MFPDNLVSITRMLSSLAIVIGIILFLSVILKKLAAGGTALGNRFKLIRMITSTPISHKKSIALVEVAGEIIAIGITSQQISMLYKIENDKALETINSIAAQKTTIKSFREHLDEILLKRFRQEKSWDKSREAAE